jgi:predicted AAA+ superfamily ATPase
LLRYLSWLDKAELITILEQQAKGNQVIRKPEKIYLNNTNFLHCIDPRHDIGTIRETFFLNQVRTTESVVFTNSADFLVNNNWTFEIGGRNKNPQPNPPDNYFLALDDIETSYRNVIPLWLFGFLY